MKKFISVLLAILLVISLVACGNSSTPTNGDPSNTPGTTGSETDESTEPDGPQVSFEPREFNKNASIEETVLVDEYDVKITATELTYNNYAAELSLAIENNSSKDLSFIANSAGYSCNSINGYMITEGYLNCDVAAGKKANDSISISYDALMLYGINHINIHHI